MSAVLPDTPRCFAGLTEIVQSRLAGCGLRCDSLPPHLASATGGHLRLSAQRWLLGRPAGSLAECRVAAVEGAASEILTVLIFPLRPDTPTFVAELMVAGGRPRLAFLDVQTPGIRPEVARRLGERGRAIARRTAEAVGGAASAPDWATEFSAGGYFFARPVRPDVAALRGGFLDYLALWIEAASQLPPRPGEASGQEALPEVARFKEANLAHSPGTAYLQKLFGPAWTNEFLHDFLYR
jgi:phycoerythrobilin:ferredoxin oxidoreductase